MSETLPTVEERVRVARARLAAAPFSPATREARLLAAEVLGWSEVQVIARGHEVMPGEAAARFEVLLERRLRGEPVAYLLGRRELWGRSFRVDRRVLIPRPETEHLIEAVLALPLPPAPRLLDVGTGSGILAVTLALELPGARVVATDLSPAALAVAAANARALGARDQVRFLAADGTDGLSLGGFDLLVSNPPYVAPEDRARLSHEVTDFEPALALWAGEGGLAFFRRLIAAGRALRPGAFLAFEIGDGQQDGVLALAAGAPCELVEVRADYAGKPRVVVLKRTSWTAS
ncbi:MAG TPA: peptide chain release factor N(5)-glutamine methyltransferase [Thermoanaerobaculia bacterium]|nr:peptide chain release factor N(5)-glutamine methyltransferase [Thermoanaerobaculia bacterium]